MHDHDKTRAKHFIEQFSQFAEGKSPEEREWQDIANNVYPARGTFGGHAYAAKNRTHLVYDGTPLRSLGLLVSAMHTMMTNPATQWFQYETFDDRLMKNFAVQRWLQQASRITFLYLLGSNFHSQIHEAFTDLALFGNSSVFVEYDPVFMFRFTCRSMSETFWMLDDQRQPSEYARFFEMTPHQMARHFGKDALHPKVIKQLEDHKAHMTVRFRIIHMVVKREEWEPLAIDGTKRRWASIYVDMDNMHIMQEDGYHEKPHGSCRWEAQTGSNYGRGPAANALVEARALHIAQKHYIRSVQKSTDPAIMAPDQAFVAPLRLSAGAINYYKNRGSMANHSPAQSVINFPQGTNYPVTKDYIVEQRTAVRESFYVDQLKLAERDRMTTVEVHRRVEEGNRILAPITGRAEAEQLRPIAQRCFNICWRRGAYPPPPSELKGQRLRVKMVSPIAKSLKIGEVQALTSAMDALTPFAQVNPQIMESMNNPALLKFVFEAFEAPLEVIKDPEEMIEKIEEQEQQQAAMQNQEMQMQGAQQMSEAIKNVASASKDLGGMERMQAMIPA